MGHDQIGEVVIQIVIVLGNIITSSLAWIEKKKVTKATKQTRRLFWIALCTMAAMVILIVFTATRKELPYKRVLTHIAYAARNLAVDTDFTVKTDADWEKNWAKQISAPFEDVPQPTGGSQSQSGTAPAPPPTVFGEIVLDHKKTLLKGIDKIQETAAHFEEVYPESSSDLKPLRKKIDKLRQDINESLDVEKLGQKTLMKEVQTKLLEVLDNFKNGIDEEIRNGNL